MADAKKYRRKQDGIIVGPLTVEEAKAGLAGFPEEFEEVPDYVLLKDRPKSKGSKND